MKSLFDWHALYALFMDIQNSLEPLVRTVAFPLVYLTAIPARTRLLIQTVHSRLGAKTVGHP
jgi:hypothetical protein